MIGDCSSWLCGSLEKGLFVLLCISEEEIWPPNFWKLNQWLANRESWWDVVKVLAVNSTDVLSPSPVRKPENVTMPWKDTFTAQLMWEPPLDPMARCEYIVTINEIEYQVSEHWLMCDLMKCWTLWHPYKLDLAPLSIPKTIVLQIVVWVTWPWIKLEKKAEQRLRICTKIGRKMILSRLRYFRCMSEECPAECETECVMYF